MKEKELSDQEMDAVTAAGAGEYLQTELNGLPCNDDLGLEKEAEIMGQRARSL